ncbi:MAG: FKBP-type peptidyl-prolyl cis-trans isomerase [Prevotella sp.]|nr:FKBP-type peptidyl-prolyl cis-trans isomerase [Prevotella sp.]
MRRILLILLIFTSVLCIADNKDSLDYETDSIETKIILADFTDSLSYAAGRANAANGIVDYIKFQLDVDISYLEDFIRGFKEAINRVGDKKEEAYIAGHRMAHVVNEQMIPNVEMELNDTDIFNRRLFIEGFLSHLEHKDSLLNDSTAELFYETYVNGIQNTRVEKTRKTEELFLKENAEKKGIKVTSSGLQYRVIKKGKGDKAKANDKVTVKYVGRTIDGKVFDDSDRYSPEGIEVNIDQTIKGWSEGLQLMNKGAIYELYIPYNLAYGESGDVNNIPPYATLIYEIELLEIERENADE